jgi:hypothetical protein
VQVLVRTEERHPAHAYFARRYADFVAVMSGTLDGPSRAVS